MDASRVLPVFGLFLFLLPLLWKGNGSPDAQVPSFGAQAVFLFAVWFFLIVAAVVLARLLPGDVTERGADDADGA